MTKQVNVKTFIHKVSSGNRGVDPPGPMPNPAVKRSTADGTAEGIRGMAREPNQCFSDLCESASLSTMAREPKGRFCLLCEVG